MCLVIIWTSHEVSGEHVGALSVTSQLGIDPLKHKKCVCLKVGNQIHSNRLLFTKLQNIKTQLCLTMFSFVHVNSTLFKFVQLCLTLRSYAQILHKFCSSYGLAMNFYIIQIIIFFISVLTLPPLGYFKSLKSAP